MKPLTLIEQFYQKEQDIPDEIFLKQPYGSEWKNTTWGEAGRIARKLASAIKSYNLPPKSNIGLMSKNCAEWIIVDLAIMISGNISVPLYATLTGDQLSEVIDLGDIVLMFLGKTEVWEDMKHGIPQGLDVIKMPHYEGNSKIDIGREWDEVLAKNEPLVGNPAPDMSDIWTIVFTSGTTGTPKGVMLDYQILYELLLVKIETNNLKLSFTGDNRFFSYLPLNHIAERAIVECSCIDNGGSISFAENLATFTQNLVDTQPTVFFAVPRIWTKFQLGILQKMPQAKLDKLLKIPIVSSIIKRRIVRGLGLDKSRVSVSGAAPITQECKDWYAKIGIQISEGYGMTENCAVCTWLRASDNKPGSVGKPAAGVELKIDPESGEVLMRAKFLMKGYYKNPEQTEKTIVNDWLHTGDQGRIDEDGYLYLTGRIKDTFKTAKGKFIVPAPIEFKFTGNKDIEQICLLGLGLPQPVALITLSEIGKAKDREELKDSLYTTLEKANSVMDSYKKVSTIIILKEPFSVENGMLTPTLKTKRNKVNQKYSDYIEKWHNADDAVVFES